MNSVGFWASVASAKFQQFLLDFGANKHTMLCHNSYFQSLIEPRLDLASHGHDSAGRGITAARRGINAYTAEESLEQHHSLDPPRQMTIRSILERPK